MPRSYESLVLAASSHRTSKENRRTELYAAVLDEHDGFAGEVLKHVGLPTADRYEASTQEFRQDGFVDLILIGFDSRGVRRTVLYGEHKEPAGKWQPGQPKKYLPHLAAEQPPSAARRLVAVVDSAADVHGRVRHRAGGSMSAVERAAQLQTRKREPNLVYTTWQAIGGCAEQAGQKAYLVDHPGETDGLRWREYAALPTAPARERLLLELIWYLEDKGYAVTTPLTKEQVAIYHQAIALDETLLQLIKTAADFLTEADAPTIARLKLKPHGGADVDDGQRFDTSRDTWLDAWGGELWLSIQPDTRTSRTREAGLRIWVEAYFDEKGLGQRLANRKGFIDQIGERKLRFEPYDDELSINDSIPVTQLFKYKTIEEQARVISDWATGAFERLLTLRPGKPPPSAR
ncbi:MAG: hypothetical protein ACRDLT_08170 [Solirubrobacteraceae bacterium]